MVGIDGERRLLAARERAHHVRMRLDRRQIERLRQELRFAQEARVPVRGPALVHDLAGEHRVEVERLRAHHQEDVALPLLELGGVVGDEPEEVVLRVRRDRRPHQARLHRFRLLDPGQPPEARLEWVLGRPHRRHHELGVALAVQLARDVETSTNDTGLATALLAHHPDTSLEQRALEVLPLLRGAFSFVWMNEDTLYAARDPQGIRPLVLGRLDRGWVVASEDAALATVGASVVREIEPGELVAIDENGLRSHHFAEPAPKGCVFEYVYLARPDAT